METKNYKKIENMEDIHSLLWQIEKLQKWDLDNPLIIIFSLDYRNKEFLRIILPISQTSYSFWEEFMTYQNVIKYQIFVKRLYQMGLKENILLINNSPKNLDVKFIND